MTNSYTMNPGGCTATRSGDGAGVPWDTLNGRPVDINGEAGAIWRADGSPAALPAPAPPAPTVSGDAVLDALSPAQAAKADVRDLIRLRGVPDVAMVKSKLKRIAAANGTSAEALVAGATPPP